MANYKFTIQLKKQIVFLFLLFSGLSFGQTKWTDWTFNSGFPTGPASISTSLGGAISSSPATINNFTNINTDYNIPTCGAVNINTSPYFEYTINHTATNVDLDRFVMAIKYQIRPTEAYNPNYTYGLDLRTSIDNYASSMGTKTIPNNFDANLISWNLLSLNSTSASPLKIRVYFYNLNSFVDASNNVYNAVRVQLSNTFTTNLDLTPAAYQSTNKAASLWYNTATIPNTTPTVTLSSTSLSSFAACPYTPSAAQTFNVSGINLTGNVNFSAVTGYEYSTDGSTYQPTLSLAPTAGTLASTSVSVRLKSSLTPGSPSGTISISSTGVTTQTIAVTGTIPAAPYPYDRVVNFSSGGHLTKSAGASINLTNWTVEAWIYPTAWNYLAGIISKRDFQFMTNNNGALSVMIERDWSWELTTTANNVVVLNKWQHVAASYNASTKVVKIYVNGTLVHTFTRTQGFVPDFNSFDLKVGYNNGQGNGTPTRNFAGNIDEVKIWNTVRTDSEVSTNYSTQLVGNETGLTAYYKFDQGIGSGNNTTITSLTDLTSNANHLTPASSSPVYAMNGTTNNILQIGPAILSSPSICLNATSTLTHTNSGGTWSTSNASIISINSATGAATANATGSATITYNFTDNGCNYTSTKLFTVLALPAITAQPATSAQNICINGTATALSVTATGAGITYQWYKNTTSSNTGGTLIAGATSASYTPLTTSAGDAYYYCIVSGSCSPTDTSDVSGLIKVFGQSVAGSISSSVVSICDSGSATLTLSGNTGSIQWQILDNSVWTDISGETASTYTTPTLSQITNYRTQVTNGTCSSVTSTIFSLPLNTSPAAPSATTTYNYCPNATATALTATALSGYSLQWYTQAVGGTASSTAPTPITSTTGSTTYYVSQKQTPITITTTTSSGTTTNYINGTNFGQTFQVATSCKVSSLAIGQIFAYSPIINVKIYNGFGGTLLGTADATMTGSGYFNPVFTFANSNIILNANQTYYFEVSSSNSVSIYLMSVKTNTTSTGVLYQNNVSNSALDFDFTLIGPSITNPCESPRTAITVNVNANPTISGVQNMTLGGSTLQLTATETPATTNPWVSSNTSIATISSTGEVTAVAGGSTNITYTTIGGCSVSSILKVVDCNQPLGNALAFGNGTSAFNADYIQIPSRIFPTQSVANFTIETWVKPAASDIMTGTTGTNWLSILGYSGVKRSPSLYITNNGVLHASWSEGFTTTGTAVSASTPTSLYLNKWTHVALVKDGTTMRLYANGIQIATVACLANIDVPDNAYWLGKSDQQFSGTLDEVRFWSTVRSQAQIQASMNTELLGNETGLLAYFNLNEGIAGGTNTSVTTVINKANSALNGTLNSFTKTGTTSNFVGSTISTFDISGAASICANNTSQFTHPISGGTWSVTSGASATVNSSGLITALGVENITLSYDYTINGCSFTATKAVSIVTSAITAQPATTAQNLCINSSATALSITATNINTTYQWYKNTTASNSGGTLITGATAASYTPLTTTVGTLYYYCIIGGTCSPIDTSDVSGAITISAVSLVGAVSSSVASICDSGAVTLTLASNTGAIQWQSFINSVWTDITGETASTYTTPTLTQNTTYRAKVTNGACASANSSSFIVPVYASPAAPTTSATTINYCQSATSTILAATALSGYSLQWYTQAVGGTSSATAPTPSTATPGSTTYYVSQKAIAGSGNLDFAYNYSYANYITNFGQTFIPTGNVTVNSIILKEVYINNSNASTVLKIYNGFGGALLATANSPFANVNSGWHYNITFSFSSQNLILTSGQTYYFEVISNSPMYPGYSSGYANGSGYINGGIISQDFAFKLDATLNSNPCESPRTAITVNVYPNPSAPIALNDTLCLNSSPSPLTATAASGNTLQWYTVATGGTASTTAITPSTAVSGVTNYYVSQKTDSSGCESPRTTIGITVPTAPYPYDRVVNFTGGGHLTKAASASINLNDWTVEAWIYPTAWNYLAGIVCKQDFQFMTNYNGALSVMIERSWSWELTTTSNNVVTLNKWQHVAASYNASTKVVKIYVNGSLVHTFTRTQFFTPDFNSYDLKIGYNNGQGNGGPSRTFAGNIDEVKVWNTVRTNAEISSNFATQLAGNESGLKAYYRFDQGIGGGNNTAITSLTDLSGNANHLTPSSSSPVYTMNGATNNILQIGPAILSTPSICLNTTSTLTHTNSGGSWSSSDTTIISVNSSTGAATALGVGTATITYTFTSNGCTFTTTKLFTVLDVPTITAHPASTVQNVCINTASTALSVTATGAGLTYQWYKNTTANASGGVLLTGATAASYTPVTTTAGTLYYYCIVNGTCSPADTSTISGAIIVSPVSVAGTVSGTSAICSGTTSTLTLSGNIGSTIQWQRYDNPIWTDLTGETATTFTTPALTATTTYRASVTSGACAAAYTAGKVITVNPLPVISGLTTVGAGNQITLTATTTAASSNAWVSTNTSNLTVSNVGVVTGISPGNAAVVYTNNNSCKDTLDITVTTGTTLTPILTSPATNTTGATTLTINYTLPEAPLAGSVTLTFTPVGGGTPIVWNMNNLTNPTFNYVVGSNPTTISNITSGSALGFTTYDLTLAYNDSYNNPSASVTNTNIQTLAPPAISFSNATYNQVVNVPISIQTNNTGGALATFTISPSLPSGLVINPTTGLISGTTSNSLNLTSYTVTATNAAGTDSEPFNLFIDLDTDGDGVGNTTDPDIDGDGIPNGSDVDPDGDGVNNNGTDTDGDGINDSNDADIDGDGILNTPDSDVNGDGIIDNGTDADGDGINDANDPDIDGDGIPNGSDADANGDGVPDTGVTDTDGDGIVDSADSDVNGDGVIDNGTDTDTDGVNDANDPDIDGDGIPNIMDADSNGDGVIDNGTDTDGDGINDANDPDIDGDGILNGADVDVNGDGVIDNGTDTDNDGVNDSNDTDIDGDGIPNVVDADPDGDGTINNGPDTDGDGINDIADADVNGDGVIDNGVDTDNDGINDGNDPDIDGDGIPNGSDADVNGDGVVDNGVDTDGDGVNDANDTDIDGDGLANSVDNCPNVVNPSITTHPSTQLVNVCPTFTPPTLSVTAIGQDLTYQWYVNTTNSNVGGTLINGATDSTYVPSNALVGPRYYYVVVNGLCGMSKSNISGVITIQDIVNPTVVTQPVTVALNAQGTITLLASQVDNGSSDNCGVGTLAVNPSQFNCNNIGANTVTLTVTDDNGNSSSATAIVTVIDTIKPIVNTQNISVYLNAAGQVSITAADVNNGSTDNCGIASMTLDQTNFTCSNTGANTVTLTVTDVNGNVKTNTAIVTVLDTILPTVITQNAILYLNASGQASITAAQINNGSFDNCGVASVVLNQTAFTCTNVGSNTVTLTVTDTKGNVATGNAIVTIVDNTPPTIVVQNINAYLNTGGAVTITPSQVGGGSSDNCSIATMTLNNTTFNCSNLGANPVILTVVDPSNNVSTANATITVIDSIQPLLTVPADITVFTNSGCGAFGFPIGSASASDNCSVISAITNNAPAFYPVGITNIQYSVTDGSGNTTIKIQKITVIDNIIPVITAPANIITTLTAGCTKTGVNLGTPVTTDNCTIASVTNNAPVAFPVGTTTVTWTVTDASGNSSTATQTVTVTDTINPTITAPANITVNANSSCVAFNVVLGTPITADNCTVASLTNNAPAVFTLGTTTVTWTVTDASGNTATTIQTVTVVDNINPSIIAPAAISMNVIAGCSVSGLTLGTPFTIDNCSIASVTNNAPASFPVGSTTVTWTVTDGSGNTATATQLVTIIDNINPTITAPAAVTMNVVSGCSATGVVLGTPITADNCTVASVTNNAPTTFPIGTTTVVWTVTDASGKTATASQLVTIVDNIIPTITAPAAVSVNLTNGCAASNVVLGTPITADNCSVASVTNNAPAIFQLGVTTVTWTVTDASGLTATSTQTVTVIDNINPTIVAPAAITMNVTTGCNVTGLALGTPYTADNCSVATVTNNAPTTFPIGSTTVTWTVTDGSGHTATATQLVTIIDNINPTITAPAAVTMNVVSGCSATGVVLGTPITADNCTVASVTNNAPTTFPIGTTTVVWTVTDASGKTATASQLVTIVDNIIPTITAPAAVSVNLTNGCAASNVVLGTPITADNCSVASVTNNAPAIFQLGVTTVTWTVTDASGLTATSTQTVTVIDNINPTIVAPAAITMNVTTGCNVTGLALGTPYTADNCSVATVTNNAPTTFPIGSTTVTWTVTDGSGHTATATQLVTIIDNINPTITAPAAINSYIATGCSATGIVLGTPVTSDNCSVTSVTNNAPTSFPIGTTTVIWTVTDASGNTSTANQLVTVNDTLDPVITTPVAVTAYSNFGCQSVGVNLGTLTATDNCTIESITNNAPMFFPLGNTNVVWTVVDASGNSSTVTQLVTVVDTLKPTIIAPSNLEVASNTGCGASEISIGNPVVDDNCGVATINNDAPVVFVSGINIVTWTVTDNSGNVSTATQIVTVVDNVNPTAVLNNITVSLPVGSDAIITSDMIDNGSFDNCGNVTITLSQSTFNCDNLGNNTILVTVTDESGNFVSQSVVVTVNPSGIDLDLDGIDDACDQLIDETVNVPNGFTPDGDGINDKFVVVGLDSYTSKALTIYNRYGNMVYETNNYQNDWDGSSNGSELPDGTYFYILELNGSETKSGYVYINRVH